MNNTSKKLLKKIFPLRPKNARKYDYGHLLVIAGSCHYTGAPALVCLAALRSGCDVVTLVSPERAADITAGFSPSIITTPLEGDFLMQKHFDIILELTQRKDALIIGPGLGREKETLSVVRKIIEKATVPIIIDADGIYAFCKSKGTRQSVLSSLKKKQKNVIFTPHIRELETLYGKKINSDDLETIIGIAKKVALERGAVILLKGATDIITNGNEVILNKTGSPYMTSGGTGDVLAGIIGGVAAQLHARQEYDPLRAASGGASISGRAGRQASAKYQHGLIATDVIDKVPDIIRVK